MKSILIKGKFTGSINNSVTVDVYRPNSNSHPYSFSKNFFQDFEENIDDLLDDTDYIIDLTGFTTGTFELEISGEFFPPNPITDSFEETFSPGYLIQTLH